MSAPVCTIAVIVPVHNAAKYLPDCLDTIAAQQFDEFCCVLVDDGSRDESPLLCDNMAAGDARFTVIHQPPARGECRPHRRAAPGTGDRAEWIAFCDADDLYHPAFLSTLYKAVPGDSPAVGLLPVRYLCRRPARRGRAPCRRKAAGRPGASGRAAA